MIVFYSVLIGVKLKGFNLENEFDGSYYLYIYN